MEIKEFSFSADSVPLAVIVAARVSNFSLPAKFGKPSSTPTFVFSNGMELHNTTVLLRYIGRVVSSMPNFYNHDLSVLCFISV
ncbi:unnamed protein product [Linum trigynum]|uniref:GST N-terminal domain-containing protein n=1 Tax=Linum trigynum TaxID=586398 RepID=A0AAV2FPG1_9ROSI